MSTDSPWGFLTVLRVLRQPLVFLNGPSCPQTAPGVSERSFKATDSPWCFLTVLHVHRQPLVFLTVVHVHVDRPWCFLTVLHVHTQPLVFLNCPSCPQTAPWCFSTVHPGQARLGADPQGQGVAYVTAITCTWSARGQAVWPRPTSSWHSSSPWDRGRIKMGPCPNWNLGKLINMGPGPSWDRRSRNWLRSLQRGPRLISVQGKKVDMNKRPSWGIGLAPASGCCRRAKRAAGPNNVTNPPIATETDTGEQSQAGSTSMGTVCGANTDTDTDASTGLGYESACENLTWIMIQILILGPTSTLISPFKQGRGFGSSSEQSRGRRRRRRRRRRWSWREKGPFAPV